MGAQKAGNGKKQAAKAATPAKQKEKTVTLSVGVVAALELQTDQAVLVSKGITESTVKVEDTEYVVGNEEVSE